MLLLARLRVSHKLIIAAVLLTAGAVAPVVVAAGIIAAAQDAAAGAGPGAAAVARRVTEFTPLLWGVASAALALALLVALPLLFSAAASVRAIAAPLDRLARGEALPPSRRTGPEATAAESAAATLFRALSAIDIQSRGLSAGSAPATPGLPEPYAAIAARMTEAGASLRRLGEQAAQVATAAGEATTAIGHVSTGAQEQTGDLDQVATAVSQSARAIAHVSDSTRDAGEVVKAAAASAAKGKDEMARLLTVSQTIAENSRRIGRITDAITQIAVKTNILSVNASIEAARAGEQGKGFEVVAEEVGKLADNAVESARQIREIVESAAAMAEEGMHATEEVVRMMDDIAGRVIQVDRMFHTIASAMEEQQTTIRDIETNIGSLRTVAQKNAAASEEITATMLALSRLADDTRRQATRGPAAASPASQG